MELGETLGMTFPRSVAPAVPRLRGSSLYGCPPSLKNRNTYVQYLRFDFSFFAATNRSTPIFSYTSRLRGSYQRASRRPAHQITLVLATFFGFPPPAQKGRELPN